jgi:hypothetical protein
VVLEDGLTSSFNHGLRMTLESLIEDVLMNYRVVAADNLLEGRTNRVSKRLASLALGS